MKRTEIILGGLGCFVLVFALDLPASTESTPEKTMAITIDGLPVAQPSWHNPDQMDRITNDLLSALAEHGVQAVGFVNEDKLEVDGEVDPFRLKILERWLGAGNELGSHGYSHLDLHRVPPAEWMEDVTRGELEMRKLADEVAGTVQYFRHPFLHTGMSVEIQEQTASFLASRGYTVAPVTIDNSEWIYGRAYRDAYNTGDEKLKQRIGRDYVRYMLEVVEFYEGLDRSLFEGEPVPPAWIEEIR